MRSRETSHHLICLEEQVANAQANHDTFTVKLICVMFGLIVLFACLTFLFFILRFPSDKTRRTSQDCFVDVAETAADSIQKEKADSFGVTDEKVITPVSPVVDVKVFYLQGKLGNVKP